MADTALYLRLMSGAKVYVTDKWDGAEPSEEGMVNASGEPTSSDGMEVSQPWRNIHRHATDLYVVNGGYAKGILTLKGVALKPDSVAVDATNALSSPFAMAASVGTLSVKASDDVDGTTPRQFRKVCTWLVFSHTNGTTKFKWRKDQVMGWGEKPPIDL